MVPLSCHNAWINAVVLSVSAFFLLLVKPVGCQQGEDHDDPMGYQIIVPRRNLSCHECYKSVQGDACLTLRPRSKVRVQKCAVDELFCVIEKSHTDGELTTFSRKCAKDCTPGCKSAGMSFYKAQYCFNCCQQNLCNTAEAAMVASTASGDVTSGHRVTCWIFGVISAIALSSSDFSYHCSWA